ncbi:MAG: hypothetical protein J7M14_04565, partial [Planctomycetes bacterium]|nr:hypothetical protein [Planctomycetota bacterium]
MNVTIGNTARAMTLALAGLLMLSVAAAEGPFLPSGLDEETGGGPSLPGGLDEGPSLPASLEKPQDQTHRDGSPGPGAFMPEWLDLSGFMEARGGLRTQHDRREQQVSLAELRLQLELEADLESATLKLTTDFVGDCVAEQYDMDFKRGEGVIDLREAYVSFSPAQFMDVKVGRQILTWGTGDLRFINDLFPKDWQSFMIGRDIEYLKAPSDAVKVSVFGDVVNLDLVFTPLLDTDRYISGRRISFFNGTLGRRSGKEAVITDEKPAKYFRDSEAAARLSRTVGGFE